MGACEMAASSGSVPSTWVTLLDSGVPLSAFRQMGLKGWHCSPEDLTFARSLRRVHHPELCLEFLEDWDDESSRAIEVNGNAAGKLEDMLGGYSDMPSEVDFDLLKEEMEEFVRDYGHDEDLQRLMEKLVTVRGPPSDEVWVTGDLAETIDHQQLDGLSI